MKTHPLTGQRYSRAYFNSQTVSVLLLLVGVECPPADVCKWSDQERHDAGDWALRAHLSASDNTNRVPPKPAHVPDYIPLNREVKTVMELFA